VFPCLNRDSQDLFDYRDFLNQAHPINQENIGSEVVLSINQFSTSIPEKILQETIL